MKLVNPKIYTTMKTKKLQNNDGNKHVIKE